VPANKRKNWVNQLKVQDPVTGTWVDLGKWAVLEGAGVSAEESVYHDWDGPVQLGGVRTREAATVRRLYGRHANELYSQLDAWVGEAHVELSRAPTDDRGTVVGETIVYTGVLGGAKLPDSDKASSDGGELELTLHLDPALA
jgi:hypothetical protein